MARWSGWSVRYLSPHEMALRVVSLPATTSSTKKLAKSESLSRSSGNSAFTSTLVRSLPSPPRLAWATSFISSAS